MEAGLGLMLWFLLTITFIQGMIWIGMRQERHRIRAYEERLVRLIHSRRR